MKNLILILCYLYCVLTDTNVDNNKGSSPNIIVKVLNYEKDLTLKCDMVHPGHDMLWLKNNDSLVSTNGHITVKTIHNLSSLTIHWATNDDAAYYECMEVDKNKNIISITEFSVLAKPMVNLPHKKSVNENDTLQLECDVIGGTPPIVVEWTVGNKTYNENEDRIILHDSRKGIKNDLLIILKANLSDRGYISCAAYNAATEYEKPNSVRVFVRVVDKETPVRIFVWMCIGVMVLLIMIFTYEKWRRSPESDCGDGHQNNDQKS